MFPHEETKNHEVALELNSPKSNGIFATDQTPTPTGLFKNCEEYGIFEDLKHVNPFEEIFRHAVEEKTAKAGAPATPLLEEESLHTPQVFPQIDPTLNSPTKTTTKDALIKRTSSANSDLTTPPTTTNELAVLTAVGSSSRDRSRFPESGQGLPSHGTVGKSADTTTTNELETISTTISKKTVVEQPPTKKFRPIAEKPSPPDAQLLTVNLCDLKVANISSVTGTAIPIQTVKPLFKVNTRLRPPEATAATATTATASRMPTCTVTSPSSASLTPTSQLPIKERLKVILNNNKSQRAIAASGASEIASSNSSCNKNSRHLRESKTKTSGGKYDEHCMERRRAAATRYRTKMRNEHKELRKRNAELQTENEKLRVRINDLEQKLLAQKHNAAKNTSSNAAVATLPPIQIPPSSIHLIMNIPKLIVPANGQPLLQNPITYSVEKN